MPYTTDAIALADPFLNRRVKLLPCQREMVKYWHEVQGAGIRAIARLFKVDKRTIQFILFPERQKRNTELRKERGGSKIYYNREKHTTAIREHRIYKHKVLS